MDYPGHMLPQGGHLSVLVWPGGTTHLDWQAAERVLMDAGCVLSSTVQVARALRPVERVCDLDTEVMELGTAACPDAGDERIVRRGFRHPRWGWGCVGWGAAASAADPHPGEVTLSSGPLGTPAENWTKPQRAEARRLLRWCDDLLVAWASATGAPYGGVGVEAWLPSPAALRAGTHAMGWPATWWLGPDVVAGAGSASGLAAELGAAALVAGGGVLYRRWRPAEPVDPEGLRRVHALLAASA